MTKRTLLAGLAVLFAFSVTACNTIAGAGKDLQRAGESIQGAAKR